MDCTIGKYNRLHEQINLYAKSRLDQEQIEIDPKYFPIFHLLMNGKLLFNELQLKTELSKSTLSDVINKFVKSGYLEKVTCINDKRSIYIRLTNKGEVVVQKINKIDAEFNEMAFNGLSDAEILAFNQQLDQIFKNLKL